MLNPDYLDALCELDNITLGAAAVSISQVANVQVKMIKPKAKVCLREDGIDELGYSNPISLLLNIKGKISGATEFIFEKDNLDVLLDLVDKDRRKALDKVGTVLATSIFENISTLIPGMIDEILFSGEGQTEKSNEVVFIRLQFKVQDYFDSTFAHVVPVGIGEFLAGTFLGEVSSQLDEFSTKVSKEQEDTRPDIDKEKTAIDVMVAVSVRLASRKMKFADMWEMEPGSVIEFPQYVSEPVNVLVKNKVVGKGQVVTVGENFGVRITEVSDYAKGISG